MMKYSKKIYVLCFGVVVLLAGCSDFLNVNQDPNHPTAAPLTGLMTNVTFETAVASYSMGDITSFYVQYLASFNPATPKDIQDPVSFDGTWSTFYNLMTDIAVLEKQAKKQGATQYLGAAEILMALNLATVVDSWGNVPYSKAFFLKSLQPAFDDAKTLYDTVFKLLNDGIADLQKPGSTLEMGSDDLLYQGDVAQWVQLGYMLKARYLNHMSKLSSYDPDAVLTAVDKGFQGNDDDAQIAFYQNDWNPWASIAVANAGLNLGGWLSEQIIKQMDGTTYGVFDPRIEAVTDTVIGGGYKGTRNGAGRGAAPPAGERCVLTTNTFYAQKLAPVLVATYAEQKFIEAEAAFRANLPGRAYSAYLAGIKANMDKLGVDNAEEMAYLNNPKVAVGATNLTLALIFKEKYTAMFLQPEAWVDARRYDYQYKGMQVPANLNPALNGQFIRRLRYPNEVVRRNDKAPDVTLSDRIFWDKK